MKDAAQAEVHWYTLHSIVINVNLPLIKLTSAQVGHLVHTAST